MNELEIFENANPETKALIAELSWALFNALDGVLEHDLEGMTGLSNYECGLINSVRNKAMSVSFENGQYAIPESLKQ